MTASHTDDTESDNSGVVRDDVDVQALHRHIKNRGGATLSGLSKRVGISESKMEQLLRDLEADEIVTVESRMHSVHVDVVDDDGLVTDGGYLQSLLGWENDSVEDIDLPKSAVYNVLANPRRRNLVRLCGLFHNGGEKEVYLKVKTLAGTIPIANHALRVNELNDEIEQRCYSALTQTHLPQLADAGLIEYYERPKKIRLTDEGAKVADLIRHINDRCNDPSWGEQVQKKAANDDGDDGGESVEPDSESASSSNFDDWEVRGVDPRFDDSAANNSQHSDAHGGQNDDGK